MYMYTHMHACMQTAHLQRHRGGEEARGCFAPNRCAAPAPLRFDARLEGVDHLIVIYKRMYINTLTLRARLSLSLCVCVCVLDTTTPQR